MRQCSLDQCGGCLFTVSFLRASPVGLNYYSLMLPSVLLTAMADVTFDFVIDVTYVTVKRLKRHLAMPPYRHTNIQQHSRYYIPPSLSRGNPPGQGQRTRPAQYPAVGRPISLEFSPPMTQPSTSNLSRVTSNPFLSWELDRAWAPECLDARCIESLEPEALEGVGTLDVAMSLAVRRLLWE
jgi:hypothetical protein